MQNQFTKKEQLIAMAMQGLMPSYISGMPIHNIVDMAIKTGTLLMEKFEELENESKRKKS